MIILIDVNSITVIYSSSKDIFYNYYYMKSDDPYFQETVIYIVLISFSLLVLVVIEAFDRFKKWERAQKSIDFTPVDPIRFSRASALSEDSYLKAIRKQIEKTIKKSIDE